MAQATPAFNPFANPQLIANPYPLYAMLRSNNPVLKAPVPVEAGAGVWILTRYADVQSVLRDGRFSVDRIRADVVKANMDRLPANFLSGPGGFRSMLIMDPPDHTRIRSLVNKAFTPRRVADLASPIEALVKNLLEDAVVDGGFEVMADFAEPLPAVVIGELLGVPEENRLEFKQWSKELISLLGQGPWESADRFEKALEPLLDFLRGLIALRRSEPRDDLISAMIEAQEAREALTDQELLSTSFLLLLAGHETTTNLIGNGLLALLRHPDQLERLRGDPSLIDNAVEELLRYDSPVQATVRVATEDVEIGGQPIGKGALVACVIGAANRDPDVFENPDQLDVGRAEIHHLSFGFGTHFCLGAGLARLEARIAFRALVEGFPFLALEGETGQYRANPVLRGLTELRVRVNAPA